MLHHLCLVLLSFTAAAAALAHAEYKVTVVGPLESIGLDINEAGVVVGYYRVSATVTHAFLNRGKGLVDLGAYRGVSSNAVAINDKGQVLGHWTTRAGQVRGYIHDRGKFRDIGVIGTTRTEWTDINNAGYISANDGGSSYLRAPNGALTRLGFLPNTSADPDAFLATASSALNNRNQITGRSSPAIPIEGPLRGFIWTRGALGDMGDFGDVPISGLAINDRGQVTGYGSLATGPSRVAFLYHRGRIVPIDTRPGSSHPYSRGDAINNRGHVVGYSDQLSGFIWRGQRMQSLNVLIEPRQGWNILYPTAINDAGQILASARRNGLQYTVRLDLVRPYTNAVPAAEPDEEPAVEPPVSPQAATAQGKQEAAAVAREVARPVAH
ncbi:HAF repeat-containing protein [Massilia aurea]|uniref:HAF repeat-containing protein n=1 Tax=Massilia aurea TaxID=373040 RepID=UPI003462D16E